MQDEPLTPRDRQDLERLPREIEPPAGLEERVVGALRETGRLAPAIPNRRRRRALVLAAGLMLFAAGLTAGRVSAGWPPPAPADAGAGGGAAYMLLLYGAQATSADEEQARVEEYSAWAAEQAAAGRLIAAERLGEVTSVLGAAPAGAAPGAEPAGFFLIRAASAEAAAAIASDCPHLRYGGSVVVRRVGN